MGAAHEVEAHGEVVHRAGAGKDLQRAQHAAELRRKQVEEAAALDEGAERGEAGCAVRRAERPVLRKQAADVLEREDNRVGDRAVLVVQVDEAHVPCGLLRRDKDDLGRARVHDVAQGVDFLDIVREHVGLVAAPALDVGEPHAAALADLCAWRVLGLAYDYLLF